MSAYFNDHDFDKSICRQELKAFKALLDNNPVLKERKDILPFFKKHKHVAAFVGSYHPSMSNFDRLRVEFTHWGSFRSDLVIGDSKSDAYCFVEFEDASPDSAFKKSNRKVREFGPRLLHGFGQVCDWLYQLNDLKGSDDFTKIFLKKHITYTCLVVAGRDSSLKYGKDDDEPRLKWLGRHLKVDGQDVRLITYDELYRHLKARLAAK